MFTTTRIITRKLFPHLKNYMASGFFNPSTTIIQIPVEQIIKEKKMRTRSKMMDELYGEQVSQTVFNRLEELDPALNAIIQEVAYDQFWAREGLSMRDKSLVTVVSLLALKKEEQTRIHMNGLLNSGGSTELITQVMAHFSGLGYLDSSDKGMAALIDVLKSRSEEDSLETNVLSPLEDRDLRIVDLARCIAIGDQELTEESIISYMECNECDEGEIKDILIHLIVYCGFPAAMNGFAALQNVINRQLEESASFRP